LQCLAWLAPTLGLTAWVALYWGWAGGQLHLRWGWWGNTLALLVGGALAQGLVVLCWGWPDGSMAGYGVLVVTLALMQALLTRQK
jgi:hypothetical protein